MKNIIMLMALFNIAVFAQGTLTDSRDKKTYKTVKIGTQTWMAQNLDYHGEDGFLGLCYGDPVLTHGGSNDVYYAESGAGGIGDMLGGVMGGKTANKNTKAHLENCKKYGRLYDWDEAMKACPKGWHLPSDKEWQTLVDFAGGDKVAGKQLKAKNGWEKYDFSGYNFSGESSNASKCKWVKKETDNRGRVTVTEYDKCTTDEYGFSALPTGNATPYSDKFIFQNITLANQLWSATNENFRGQQGNWSRLLAYNSIEVLRIPVAKEVLASVRCIQDGEK